MNNSLERDHGNLAAALGWAEKLAVVDPDARALADRLRRSTGG